MSLPAYAIFYKFREDPEESPIKVKKIFINCGWFHEGERTTKRLIYDMVDDVWRTGDTIPEEYDFVKMYHEILSKQEVDKIIKERSNNG